MNRKVSAGPYTLELPPNGVAVLYQDGQRLAGGVGYLEALVQFAGEVIRLQAMLEAVNQAAAGEVQPMMGIPPEGWRP